MSTTQTMPVVIGEYGNSTTGNGVDPGGYQTVEAVGDVSNPSMAWVWETYAGNGDNLQSNGVLTAYGQQVAAIIAAAPGPTAPTGGNFSVANGNIINPNGTVFGGKGFGLADPADGAAALAAIPNVGIINVDSGTLSNGPAYFQALVNEATAKGIVVVIGNYIGPQGQTGGGGTYTPSTGLANETAWYASLAAAYKNNPYVWFSTLNEPSGALSDIQNEHAAIYNAIRGAGNNSMILMEGNGAVTTNGFNSSVYTGMTNVAWDTHFYNWISGYSASLATNQSYLAGQLADPASNGMLEAATTTAPPPPPPTFTPSANDATITTVGPVITDTAGNTWGLTSGGQVAINGTADTSTANVTELAYVGGDIFQENASNLWWGEANPGDGWNINPGAAASPLPSFTPSPANTVISTVGPMITDAAGNTWAITSGGQVAINGSADTTTANVTKLAYEGGDIYQENSQNLWWGEAAPGGGWTINPGAATSPLPTITLNQATNPSPNIAVSNTMINGKGTFALLLGGSADTVSLTGGNEKVTLTGGNNTVTTGSGKDTYIISSKGNVINAGSGTNTMTDNSAGGNTFVMPAIGKGNDILAGSISADTVDFKAALAATTWDGKSADVGSYLSVVTSGKNAIVDLSKTAGGSHSAIATIVGGAGQTLTTLLTHAAL